VLLRHTVSCHRHEKDGRTHILVHRLVLFFSDVYRFHHITYLLVTISTYDFIENILILQLGQVKSSQRSVQESWAGYGNLMKTILSNRYRRIITYQCTFNHKVHLYIQYNTENWKARVYSDDTNQDIKEMKIASRLSFHSTCKLRRLMSCTEWRKSTELNWTDMV